MTHEGDGGPRSVPELRRSGRSRQSGKKDDEEIIDEIPSFPSDKFPQYRIPREDYWVQPQPQKFLGKYVFQESLPGDFSLEVFWKHHKGSGWCIIGCTDRKTAFDASNPNNPSNLPLQPKASGVRVFKTLVSALWVSTCGRFVMYKPGGLVGEEKDNLQFVFPSVNWTEYHTYPKNKSRYTYMNPHSWGTVSEAMEAYVKNHQALSSSDTGVSGSEKGGTGQHQQPKDGDRSIQVSVAGKNILFKKKRNTVHG